ncbi:MAG: class I SAM-dependent methyltransferase [Panacagrimonas sp.]
MSGAKTMNDCNQFLAGLYAERAKPIRRVLEAGGGSFSHFKVPPDADVYVLDIEHGQLARNQTGGLGVQGDIQRLPVRDGSFDLVVCFNVIEHLPDPAAALNEMRRVLAPGGVLLLGCPDRNSLKGWLTRMTPIGFHRWYYRVVVGKQDRGDGHYDAFATPFRPIVSGRALKQWISDQGLDMGFYRTYDAAHEYGVTEGSFKKRVVASPYRAVGWYAGLISGGTWHPLRSDLMLVAISPSKPS